MGLGIGIDTGGTYTDAVLFDFETRQVLAQGKARTTKGDLRVGICNALDSLPSDQVKQANVIALSTTLATNACVEGKGGRAKAILVGTNENVLRRIDITKNYGISLDDSLCIDVSGSHDGKVVNMPDWDAFMEENADVLSQVQAFGIAEVFAERNGAVVEHEGARQLEQRFGVPVIVASSLVNGLNMMERGATAVLNARLLPVIRDFLDATTSAMRERGIEAPIMVVRSDGGLMNEEFARRAPVETMVSGPAASVQGVLELAPSAAQTALVVDMGGTTSDISLIERGEPARTKGIRIGNWRTQVSGVYIDTFGLGGDSAVTWEKGILALAERRVEPLCMAASRWPHLVDQLQNIVDTKEKVFRPIYEVLYLVREPAEGMEYTEPEQRLIELLRKGPVMIGAQTEFENYALERNRIPERLENEGVVMRCGLTPTDIMHINGDFSQFDTRISLLAVQYLAALLPMYDEGLGAVEPICDAIYNLVKRKLYTNVVRVLLQYAHPKVFVDGLPPQLEQAILAEWEAYRRGKRAEREHDDVSLHLDITTKSPLVGVGGPIHVFLPDVAQALGTTCTIPAYAKVANAVGAVVAGVTARVQVRVIAEWSAGGIDCYTVNADQHRLTFETYEEAVERARIIAVEKSERLARERGAAGDIAVSVEVEDETNIANGVLIYHGSMVTAVAQMAEREE